MRKKHSLLSVFFCFFLFVNLPDFAFAQAEMTAWGNLQGIRMEGELFEFQTSLRVVGENWEEINQTAKEQQLPKFERDGDKQMVSSRLDSLYFTKVLEDTGEGRASVEVEFTARKDTTIEGAFYCITLPYDDYLGGSMQLEGEQEMTFAEGIAQGKPVLLQTTTSNMKFTSDLRQLEVNMEEPTEVIIRKDEKERSDDFYVYMRILPADVQEGQTASLHFTLEVSGRVDLEPVVLRLDTSQTGRRFDGLGGNFRLQNPDTDPQVIDYSLENLRVSWGRVEMPWRYWHAEESTDPVEAAKNGELHPRVHAAMEMAQRLDQKGIPVILSNWSAPDWAIEGPFSPQPVDGIWGNRLRDDKMEKIYESIADYIEYMKDEYGVEVVMFSFNESDLGINIRQTGEEHAHLIKGLGPYLAARGLQTKMLLGDNSDANTIEFIYPAMEDPETHPYIGAVSFHSWRGWADTTLANWDAAASQLDIPLIVGEGSIDAAAWRYPAIFEEPIYAMEEINLYTRIMAICEPLTILQWQLTADYSPMAGGGIFGNEEPLRPTRRFWNLKQLASTPEGLYAMPISSNKENVTSAAQGDPEKGIYAVHLVNNGPTREATLSGLPASVKELQIYITDDEREMEEGQRIEVRNGQATFTLEAVSYTTLIDK